MLRKTSSELPCTQAYAIEHLGPPWYLGEAERGWMMPHNPERNAAYHAIDGCSFRGGRVVMRWLGVEFSAARMVWFMNTGVWPTGQMGIRNHNQSDIRFANLIAAGEPDVSDLV